MGRIGGFGERLQALPLLHPRWRNPLLQQGAGGWTVLGLLQLFSQTGELFPQSSIRQPLISLLRGFVWGEGLGPWLVSVSLCAL